ncbi:hypothetical protein CHL67_06605 [Prosthecochloris sp. GSB1]|uniref:hypothetical protein n=1 Tax=Prosthecochloris sp. GSB1 TaxID=281093 RepID=UPI000B8C8CB5|nr:hypothetical protein [Prosthecochloris sp. GSB1]ASQ90639.1 hypothetical protein CHL67_06605 [Prosthecochloris sp. GSB1]
MPLENDFKKLKYELAVLQKSVGELRSDKGARSLLPDEERRRVDDILDALHEDMLVFERGLEIIDELLAEADR